MSSYVKQGTCVVCTNMTCGVPRKVGVGDNDPRYTLYDGDSKQPLLNCMDRKMSDSFDCKMPQKFWGGLAMLAAGIALAAATVLTGGAALVVVAACAATVAVSTVGMIYDYNDCDATLRSKWNVTHESAFIGGQQALLSISVMTCEENGGVITIIVNPATAQAAAEYITKQNNQEIGKHLLSQFLEGFVGGYFGGASVAGVCIMGGFYIYFEDKKSPDSRTTVWKTLKSTGTPAAVQAIETELEYSPESMSRQYKEMKEAEKIAKEADEAAKRSAEEADEWAKRAAEAQKEADRLGKEAADLQKEADKLGKDATAAQRQLEQAEKEAAAAQKELEKWEETQAKAKDTYDEMKKRVEDKANKMGAKNNKKPKIPRRIKVKLENAKSKINKAKDQLNKAAKAAEKAAKATTKAGEQIAKATRQTAEALSKKGAAETARQVARNANKNWVNALEKAKNMANKGKAFRAIKKGASRGLFESLGRGLFSFAATFGLEYYSNKWEDEDIEAVRKYKKQDSDTIGIVSQL